MSSLLQFHGSITRRGVGLEFYHVDHEEVACPLCGRSHPQLFIAYRKPRGTWGHWVVFMYNGEEHVPDLSVPIEVDKLPRDAKPVNFYENARSWHSE